MCGTSHVRNHEQLLQFVLWLRFFPFPLAVVFQPSIDIWRLVLTSLTCLALIPSLRSGRGTGGGGSASLGHGGGELQQGQSQTCFGLQGVQPQGSLETLPGSGHIGLEVGIPQSQLCKGCCLVAAPHTGSRQPVTVRLAPYLL